MCLLSWHNCAVEVRRGFRKLGRAPFQLPHRPPQLVYGKGFCQASAQAVEYFLLLFVLDVSEGRCLTFTFSQCNSAAIGSPIWSFFSVAGGPCGEFDSFFHCISVFHCLFHFILPLLTSQANLQAVCVVPQQWGATANPRVPTEPAANVGEW